VLGRLKFVEATRLNSEFKLWYQLNSIKKYFAEIDNLNSSVFDRFKLTYFGSLWDGRCVEIHTWRGELWQLHNQLPDLRDQGLIRLNRRKSCIQTESTRINNIWSNNQNVIATVVVSVIISGFDDESYSYVPCGLSHSAFHTDFREKDFILDSRRLYIAERLKSVKYARYHNSLAKKGSMSLHFFCFMPDKSR